MILGSVHLAEMRLFLQNQAFSATQEQEKKFLSFGNQARKFLETTGDFYITLISQDWDTLERKGSRYGAFLVSKNILRGGKRFSALPEFFDPSRLSPALISVPTGSTVTNLWLFVGSQDSFYKKCRKASKNENSRKKHISGA